MKIDGGTSVTIELCSKLNPIVLFSCVITEMIKLMDACVGSQNGWKKWPFQLCSGWKETGEDCLPAEIELQTTENWFDERGCAPEKLQCKCANLNMSVWLGSRLEYLKDKTIWRWEKGADKREIKGEKCREINTKFKKRKGHESSIKLQFFRTVNLSKKREDTRLPGISIGNFGFY